MESPCFRPGYFRQFCLNVKLLQFRILPLCLGLPSCALLTSPNSVSTCLSVLCVSKYQQPLNSFIYCLRLIHILTVLPQLWTIALGPYNAAPDPYGVSTLKLSWDITAKVCSFSLLRVGVVLLNLTILFFSDQNDCDLSMNCFATECFCQIGK